MQQRLWTRSRRGSEVKVETPRLKDGVSEQREPPSPSPWPWGADASASSWLIGSIIIMMYIAASFMFAFVLLLNETQSFITSSSNCRKIPLTKCYRIRRWRWKAGRLRRRRRRRRRRRKAVQRQHEDAFNPKTNNMEDVSPHSQDKLWNLDS